MPKGDGEKCLVIDYRALNKVTWKFVWSMSKLNGAKYFSSLNLHAGYHHIPLDEDSSPKTAFTSPFGKYEYLKVPVGLAQALAYFQELMNKVLKDVPFIIAHFNDIIIYSKTAEDHLDHLQQVFHKLQSYRTVKLSVTSSPIKSNIWVVSSALLASNHYLPKQQLLS